VDSLHSRLAAVVAALAVIVLPLAFGACGGSDADSAAPEQATHRDFDAGNFPDQPKIDNKFNPNPPGTQYVFEGRSDRGRGRLPHRVIFTVTDLTKVVNGVRTVVMWDQDINAGKLLEGELAFHAQDNDGNVWNLGEFPGEFDEEGKFEGAPDAWLAGRQTARAGILMRADPKVGTSTYRQGFVPKIEFGDIAKVAKTGQKNCVPVGCYEDVLITDETNPYEPNDGHQLKYYAPEVGNIRAAPGVGGKEREVLVLVKVRRLGPEALAKVREEAVKLEKLAYRSKKSLWGGTEPLERQPKT
jgi:hypothetical protein